MSKLWNRKIPQLNHWLRRKMAPVHADLCGNFAWISFRVKNLREAWIQAAPATSGPRGTIFRPGRRWRRIEKAAPTRTSGVCCGRGEGHPLHRHCGLRRADSHGDAGGQLECEPAFTYKFGRGAGV